MPDADATARALAETLAARRDFIRYTSHLRRAQPLALHPFGWDDYLKNDPVPMALFALRAAHELLKNPRMTGELRPPRTIATLPYGVALPAEWAGKGPCAGMCRLQAWGRRGMLFAWTASERLSS